MFEFCAAGLPVFGSPNASNVRFTGEGDGRYLADGFTSLAIARVIEAALADPPAWQLTSARGRDWAYREGGWDRSETRLLGLYDAILLEDSS